VKTILVSAPSVGLTSPVSALGASWQGYLAPAGALGFSGLTAMTGLAMAGSACGDHVAADALPAVAGVVATAVETVPAATVPFAASILAAFATVAAVAGDQQVVTAPKQADKPIDPRNDASPLGVRPGAPPS
jgi:quinol-cytochrome oxidoreductase complex cytochrome b subunit